MRKRKHGLLITAQLLIVSRETSKGSCLVCDVRGKLIYDVEEARRTGKAGGGGGFFLFFPFFFVLKILNFHFQKKKFSKSGNKNDCKRGASRAGRPALL